MKNRLIIAAVLALSAAAAYASTITVLVQETALRKRAQSYAPSVGTAKLGQTFESEGLESGFYKTSAGYIHSSAVTAKKVNLGSAGSVGGSATAEEVTLAGKGFNAQVEKTYGAKNGAANFAAVNAMERRSVPENQLFDFLRAGGLMPAGGSK
ncbi:MAG: hypothetical protein COV48_16060 [Elusimicrobia bacterium CG11_big_fil_rev_8_21_14_0_20_64_6]|nr:MAG: hypothetical protein COV48_16060 [Elusimicrobia bacterium CG11_big_fil_rev_8_21_14_0_20_64_6]